MVPLEIRKYETVTKGGINMLDSLNNSSNSLRNTCVQTTLNQLHKAAGRDWMRFSSLLPKLARGRFSGKSIVEIINPAALKDIYMPISRKQGEFLYMTARAIEAKRVVEFGTSFGISTIYLAAAVQDNNGEVMIGTELVPSKYKNAMTNIKKAGLDDITDIRLGDAMETLKEIPDPLDMVLLDGWKDLYIPVLKLLKPKLRQGAVVVADNIFTFKKALRPYVEFMQSGQNGFESTTLEISDGFEYSYHTG